MFKENEGVYIVKYNLLHQEYMVLYGDIYKIERNNVFVRVYGDKDLETAVDISKVFRTRKEAEEIAYN